jgi:hypothetical protein
MAKFRKKPVVIDAIQWTGNTFSHIAIDTFMGVFPKKSQIIGSVSNGNVKLLISTLEGVMEASEGDWIIKGINGEFYPCKPDIFEKTYEAV